MYSTLFSPCITMIPVSINMTTTLPNHKNPVTIPIKKWYTAVGGKRYLHAAVSFFAENDKNQKSNGGELHG